MSGVSRSAKGPTIGLALSALIALIGCGQTGGGGEVSSNPALTPNGTPILALSTSPGSVVISSTTAGLTVLHAELLNPANHLPVGGVPVSFSASDGSLASPTVITDVNGSANDTLFVPAAATGASIDVSANAHGASRKLTIPVASLAAIELSALPDAIQCLNDSPGLSVIQVLALDASNNPLANVSVAFTVSGGATLTSAAATTDANGRATVTATA